ncbi:MAG: hypothetical protein RIS25_967 [Actinomycetota bacterium]
MYGVDSAEDGHAGLGCVLESHDYPIAGRDLVRFQYIPIGSQTRAHVDNRDGVGQLGQSLIRGKVSADGAFTVIEHCNRVESHALIMAW